MQRVKYILHVILYHLENCLLGIIVIHFNGLPFGQV